MALDVYEWMLAHLLQFVKCDSLPVECYLLLDFVYLVVELFLVVRLELFYFCEATVFGINIVPPKLPLSSGSTGTNMVMGTLCFYNGYECFVCCPPVVERKVYHLLVL